MSVEEKFIFVLAEKDEDLTKVEIRGIKNALWNIVKKGVERIFNFSVERVNETANKISEKLGDNWDFKEVSIDLKVSPSMTLVFKKKSKGS